MQTVIGRIDRAIDMTARIVDSVEPDLMTAPTPCAEWDVRAVLNHMVGGMRLFPAELAGTDRVGSYDDEWLGGDPQTAFFAAAEIDRAAWHRLDVPTATIRLRLGPLPAPAAALVHLTDVLVHGLDIALAIGRADLADDELSEELLATIQEWGGFDAFRGPGLFGPAVEVPADSAGHRKLLAYCGRTWN